MRKNYGYDAYRGRSPLRGILKWIIALLAVVLVLTVAALLWLQQFMVYSSEGGRLVFPWTEQNTPSASSSAELESPAVSPTVVVVTPEAPEPEYLHAALLPREALYDGTAADRLGSLYQSLKKKGIRFYMTEHIAELNEQLRKLGLGYMIEEGSVRRTIHIALKDMEIRRPYPLAGGVDNEERSASRKRADNRVQEFVWAFGSDTEAQIEKQILKQIEQLKKDGNVEELLHGRWSHMEALDEDEWLEHLEEHLKEIVNISGKDEKTLAMQFEAHRREVYERIAKEHPELAKRFQERRHKLDEHLKQRRPEVYELVVRLREENQL